MSEEKSSILMNLPVLHIFSGIEPLTEKTNLYHKGRMQDFAFSHRRKRISLRQYFMYDGHKLEEHEHALKGLDYKPFKRESLLHVKEAAHMYPMFNGYKLLLNKNDHPYAFVDVVEGVPCCEYLCHDGEKPVLVPIQLKLSPKQTKEVYDFLKLEIPEPEKPSIPNSFHVARPIAMPRGKNTLSGIQALLDTILVGQEAAKKAIAPVLHDYTNNQPHKNLVFAGDGATGKRALVSAIADVYEWPLYCWSVFNELDDIVFAHATHFSGEGGAIFLMENIYGWGSKGRDQVEKMMRGEQAIATKRERSVSFDSRKFLYVFTDTFTTTDKSAKKNVEKRKAKFTELRGKDLTNFLTADFLSQVVVAPFEELTEEEQLRAITETPLSYAVQKANQLGKPIVFADGVLEEIVKETYPGVAQNHVEVLLREAMNDPEAYTIDGKILIRAQGNELPVDESLKEKIKQFGGNLGLP